MACERVSMFKATTMAVTIPMTDKIFGNVDGQTGLRCKIGGNKWSIPKKAE